MYVESPPPAGNPIFDFGCPDIPFSSILRDSRIYSQVHPHLFAQKTGRHYYYCSGIVYRYKQYSSILYILWYILVLQYSVFHHLTLPKLERIPIIIERIFHDFSTFLLLSQKKILSTTSFKPITSTNKSDYAIY